MSATSYDFLWPAGAGSIKKVTARVRESPGEKLGAVLSRNPSRPFLTATPHLENSEGLGVLVAFDHLQGWQWSFIKVTKLVMVVQTW